MNVIKNLHKVKDLTNNVEALEKGASLHKRHGGIEFKILKVEGKTITVQAVEYKTFSGNYITKKELIERTKMLFSRFFPDYKILVHATNFIPHPSQKINEKWVQKQMLEKHLKVKDLVEITGLEKSNISAWINGKRPMSNIVKSLFYSYLNN